MNWVYILDLFGTAVFAISGVSIAIKKKFDLVGALVIGFVTAIGGGTIRDVMIGRFPVGWLNDRNYIFSILIGCFIALILFKTVKKLRKVMLFFDTIGIGLFTILGIQVSMQSNLRLEICLIMGVISACFGGVIRDVLVNEIPLIFQREIYASACLFGGITYLLLHYYSGYEALNMIISMLVVILIRYLSITLNWSLNFIRH
jgi:uncharacterized membrane protein YeiH